MSIAKGGGLVGGASVGALGDLPKVGFEISIIKNDAHSILYNVPFGKLVFDEAGRPCVVVKPLSLRECEIHATDRISTADSQRLLALEEGAKKAELIFAKQVKDTFSAELSVINSALPVEDVTTELTSDFLPFFRLITKKNVRSFLSKVTETLSEDEGAQRAYHAKNGVGDTFEEYMATTKRTHLQMIRFLESSAETLYEDLFLRTFEGELSILKKHCISLGLTDELIEAKYKELTESKKAVGDKSQTAKELEYLVKINLLKMHLFEKQGLVSTTIFSDYSENPLIIAEKKKLEEVFKLTGAKEIDVSSLLSALLDISVKPKEAKDLVSFLKEHGPFAASGFYGKARYLEAPLSFKIMPKLGERDVLYWKVDAKKNDAKNFAHCVTIVGCSTEGPGLVYFLDPQEPSDPSDKTLEKVYLISFKNFIRNFERAFYNPGKGVALRA